MVSFLYAGQTDSYGTSGRKLAEVLAGRGIEVRSMMPEADGVKAMERIASYSGPRWVFDGPVVAYTVADWLRHVDAPWVAIWTMYEGKGLPRERVELINEFADLCLVPSRWCAKAFEACGVRVPIEVVPLGVCGTDWPYLNRAGRDDRPYKFLWNGLHDGRKAWDLVYDAFWQAFRGSGRVELILHFRERESHEPNFADGNVREVQGWLPRGEMLDLVHEADCYVFPSRGEGWGLPPREAAATGLPVLVTDYAGLAEGIEDWALPVRVCREKETTFVGSDERFLIAEPCVNDVRELMVWCFENQDAARMVGQDAANWLRREQSWERSVDILTGVVADVECVGGDSASRAERLALGMTGAGGRQGC